MNREEFKNNLFSGPFSLDLALELFRFQSENVPVYNEYVNRLGIDRQKVNKLEQIPFLPIQFFKSHRVVRKDIEVSRVFRSSRTSGQIPSEHHIGDMKLYHRSIVHGFEAYYGAMEQYSFRFLLPSYLERTDSSLVEMARFLNQNSELQEEAFFLHDLDGLIKSVQKDKSGKKLFLIGVSFALIELAKLSPHGFENAIVMETGGMKGRGKEMVRSEMHEIIKKGLGIQNVHGEYGMTELMSQAYALSNGIYKCPSSMKVLIRESEDPFNISSQAKSGAINVIDLANIDSCAFIATDDIGRLHADGSFEVLGRFDRAEVRGCNLMAI